MMKEKSPADRRADFVKNWNTYIQHTTRQWGSTCTLSLSTVASTTPTYIYGQVQDTGNKLIWFRGPKPSPRVPLPHCYQLLATPPLDIGFSPTNEPWFEPRDITSAPEHFVPVRASDATLVIIHAHTHNVSIQTPCNLFFPSWQLLYFSLCSIF